MPNDSKIKQTKGNERLQASRFKPCPPKLAYFIDLVNIFPPGKSVSPDDFKDKHDLRTTEGEYRATLDCIAQLPPSKTLDEYMRPPENLEPFKEDEDIFQYRVMRTTIERYKLLESAQHIFIMIILNNEVLQKFGKSVLFSSTGGGSYFFINKEGIIGIEANPLEDALVGVEANRIRRCEACKRAFWAGRMTQKGCSARCGDIIRKRRYRERYKQGFYQGAKLTEKEKAALILEQNNKAKKGK